VVKRREFFTANYANQEAGEKNFERKFAKIAKIQFWNTTINSRGDAEDDGQRFL